MKSKTEGIPKDILSAINKVNDPAIIAKIRNYCEDRNHRLLAKARKLAEKRHFDHIKTLKEGTKVLIRYGRRAGDIGNISSIGRKYVVVKMPDNTYWRFPFDYVIDNPTDHDKSTARLNKDIGSVFNG